MKEINTVKDLMNNEELMSYVTEDIEDFEEDAVVTYEVWAIGYNTEDVITDTEMCIGEFVDPDQAVKKAKSLTLADIIHQAVEEDDGTRPTTDVARISIEVETVVEEDEGTMNVGTIYKRDIQINEEFDDEPDDIDPTVNLNEGEYELVEDGMLKVSCKLLKDFNKNDCVKICFKDENYEVFPLTYKIMSKVTYEDGDYYHCEFIY
jgi:hypothetical protein